jgi:hypothetical protein
LAVHSVSTLPRNVIKEYDPIGKFLLIVVLVGEEGLTEVPEAPEAPDAEDEPEEWPEEAPCVVTGFGSESPLDLLVQLQESGALMACSPA